MITEKQEIEINKILRQKRWRTYFDRLSHEFGDTEIEFKIDRLAQLVKVGYFDIVIDEYLERFENDTFYHKLTIMKSALAETLKGFLGIIRYGDMFLIDNSLFHKNENDLDFIISAFKKDIIDIYIPKRGYANIFVPYL